MKEQIISWIPYIHVFLVEFSSLIWVALDNVLLSACSAYNQTPPVHLMHVQSCEIHIVAPPYVDMYETDRASVELDRWGLLMTCNL